MKKKKTSKKDSDPNFEQNLEEMTCNFERLISLLDENQAKMLSPEHTNRIGIDESLTPVKMGFTGKNSITSWEDLSNFFAEDRDEETIQRHNASIVHQPKVTNHVDLRRAVAKNSSAESLSTFTKIVVGDEIHEAFKIHRPGSCMRYKKCQPWQKIYVNNPDDVDIMVFGIGCGLTGGKTSSWLRWKGDRTNFFDKAYYESDSQIIEIVREKIGPMYGVVSGQKTPTVFKLNWKDSHRLPYMDTFIYCKECDEKAGFITLSSQKPRKPMKNYIVRNHEHGWHPTREPDGFFRCETCSSVRQEDQRVELHESVDSEMCLCLGCARYCEYMGRDHGFFPTSACNYHVYYNNGRLTEGYISSFALSRDFVQNCFGTRYVRKGEEITLACGSVCSPSDIKNDIFVVKDVNGEYRKREECVKVKGRWFLVEDCVQIDYVWYNKSSNEVLMDYDTNQWVLLNPPTPQTKNFFAKTNLQDYQIKDLDKRAAEIYSVLSRANGVDDSTTFGEWLFPTN